MIFFSYNICICIGVRDCYYRFQLYSRQFISSFVYRQRKENFYTKYASDNRVKLLSLYIWQQRALDI